MKLTQMIAAAFTRRGPRNPNPNERRPDESFQDYRERLRAEQAASRGRIGRLLWPSYKGTYIRAQHGPLGD